jgi:hypothetical protein
MDARNITLEPEYYSEVDVERFQERKPLIWMWQLFDRSPLGGNIHLGVRFRRLLAPYIFKRVGRNFKCFHFVEFSFGYNLEVGRRRRRAPERPARRPGWHRPRRRVSISDYANVYSHTHSIVDQVGCDRGADGDRGRGSDHVSRDRAGRHPGG